MDRPLVVLLAEERLDDHRRTAGVLQRCALSIQLFCVEDGPSALGFLRQEGEYRTCPRPDLVLLDLELPRLSGRDVLAALRDDPDLRAIPVVVQTNTEDDAAVADVFALGAHDLVGKPLTQEAFLGIAEYVTEFA